MTRLVVIGAGGHGKVVADAAEAQGKFDAIVFIDRDESQTTVAGVWPVVSHRDNFAEFDDQNSEFFVAIGNNAIRAKVLQQLIRDELPIATIVHPSAVVSPYSQIGSGSLICANSVINPFTNVGVGCILNTGCSVDHDNRIGDFVHIAPGCRLAGTVTVGRLSFLGAASVVIPNTEIGEEAQTGAGSVVIRSLPPRVLAVGVPAKIIK